MLIDECLERYIALHALDVYRKERGLKTRDYSRKSWMLGCEFHVDLDHLSCSSCISITKEYSYEVAIISYLIGLLHFFL